MVDTYVVDSVAVSDVMDGVELLRSLVLTARILIPVIVLGEIYFAYENSSRKKENYLRFAQLAEKWRRRPVTEQTAPVYADVQLAVKGKGKKAPLNDLLDCGTGDSARLSAADSG